MKYTEQMLCHSLLSYIYFIKFKLDYIILEQIMVGIYTSPSKSFCHAEQKAKACTVIQALNKAVTLLYTNVIHPGYIQSC